jgi:transposase
MGEVSTIGLDIAKSVFQVHGVDVDGTVVIRKRVSRAKVLELFRLFRPALLASKLAQVPIIGAESFGRSAIRSADATQLCEGLSQAQ